MTMIFPALDRLGEIDRLARLTCVYELYAALVGDRPARRSAGERASPVSGTSFAPRFRPMTATGLMAPRSSGSPRSSKSGAVPLPDLE